jgi:hypothetical protein
MTTLDLRERLAILVLWSLLLGVLIVAVRDGITAGGGVFSLVFFALLSVTVIYAGYVRVKESDETEGEEFSPVITIVIGIVVFVILGLASLAKMEETEGPLGWFPLTKYSTLTLMGVVVLALILVVGFVGTYFGEHVKPKLIAWAERHIE